MNNDTMRELDVIKHHLEQDGVICYPTEGVWGVGCLPQSQVAFKKLLSIKQRSQAKGVILIVSQYNQMSQYTELDESIKQKLSTYWPGFTTCVLPKHPQCPNYLVGEHQGVAIRMTNYQLLIDLCDYLESALVSTSANISGCPSVTTIDQAKALFGNQIDYYWDRELGGQKKPSAILKLTTHQTICLRQ